MECTRTAFLQAVREGRQKKSGRLVAKAFVASTSPKMKARRSRRSGCDGRPFHSMRGLVSSQNRMLHLSSDERVARQILEVFIQYKIRPLGVLRRNNFMGVRDADFQRGLNKAVE